MRIGLISDTHHPSEGRELPLQVARAFAGVDLILHAGDIKTVECLDILERIAPVVAVEVPPAPAMGDPRVSEKTVLDLEGYAVGMVHDLIFRGMGWEMMPGMMATKYPASLSLAGELEFFFGRTVGVVVFGHTHFALVETHQDILFVNSGSPVLPNQTRRLGTVGILELTPTVREAKIVNLADY